MVGWLRRETWRERLEEEADDEAWLPTPGMTAGPLTMRRSKAVVGAVCSLRRGRVSEATTGGDGAGSGEGTSAAAGMMGEGWKLSAEGLRLEGALCSVGRGGCAGLVDLAP